MKNLNYIKLFEEYDSENEEEEEDYIFSLTEEDIQDLFLPITDNGFKIEIKKEYVNAADNYEKLHGWPGSPANSGNKKAMTSAIVENNIRGAYYIYIRKKNEDEDYENDIRKMKYTSEDIILFKSVMNEISQISKRVEHIEWETSDFIDIFIVCNKLDNKKSKRRFLSDQYKSELNNRIYSRVISIRDRVIQEYTRLFKDSVINRQHKNNHFYFFFKPVNKAVINLNMKKLDKLIGWQKIKNIKVKDLDEFKKENPNIEIPNKTSFIIDVNFDYDSIVRMSKEYIKGEFIYR